MNQATMRSATVVRALGLALVLVAGSAGAADSGGGPSVSERLSNARTYIQKNDWSRALFELNQAARDEPRNADVHNLLGYTYRKRATPDLAKAFDHYRTALRLNPDHKGAHEYIGEAYLMDQKPDEAEKHLAQIERICGNKTCDEHVALTKAIGDYRNARR